MTADHMAIAAGRALCKLSSESCNIDFDDNWKFYGEHFIEDADAALEASGARELLTVLEQLTATVSDSLTAGGVVHPSLAKAREAIAKALGEQS